MIRTRRRAVMLLEVLSVLLIVTVGGTIMAVGVAAIVQTHKRTAALTNRYAVLNDFLRCIRQDVASASRIVLQSDGADAPATLILTFADPAGQRRYRLFDNRVERSGFSGGVDQNHDKVWALDDARVTFSLMHPPAGGPALLKVVVQWHRWSRDALQPGRRFAVLLRVKGEQPREPE